MEPSTEAVATGWSEGGVRDVPASHASPRVREYFALRDTLAEPGCPICARVLRAGRELLAEMVREPSAEARSRKGRHAFRSLCNAHAWTIHPIALRSVGLAEAYEVFLRGRVGTLQRAMACRDSAARRPWPGWIQAVGGWLRASLPRLNRIRRCPACRAAQAVERRDLGLLLDFIPDMEFARAFESSGGLCLPHLNLILRIAPNHPNLPRLLQAHILKVKRLHASLQDFLRQARAPLATLNQAEREVIWERVFEWTTGKAGVFGHERDFTPEGGGWGTTSACPQRAGTRSVSESVGTEGSGSRMDELERLSLENAKLQRRLVEVSREWAEESARRAALQFQVHKLTEDVKVLELNLAGARGEAKSGELQAQRLREEIQVLRAEVRRLTTPIGDVPGGEGQ